MRNPGVNRAYFVLVEAGITPEQLCAVTSDIIDKAKRSKPPFSALRIEFYDYRELMGDNTRHAMPGPLGSAVFCSPDYLVKVKPGDYDAMALRTSFPTKDWSKRPTIDDIRILQMWMSYHYDSWDKRTRTTARHLGLSFEDVERAVDRCVEWQPALGRGTGPCVSW